MQIIPASNTCIVFLGRPHTQHAYHCFIYVFLMLNGAWSMNGVPRLSIVDNGTTSDLWFLGLVQIHLVGQTHLSLWSYLALKSYVFTRTLAIQRTFTADNFSLHGQVPLLAIYISLFRGSTSKWFFSWWICQPLFEQSQATRRCGSRYLLFKGWLCLVVKVSLGI